MDPTIKLELSLGEFRALSDLCKVAFAVIGERPKAASEAAAAIDPSQANAAVMKLVNAIQILSEKHLALALLGGAPTGGLAKSISELQQLKDLG